MNPYQTLFDIHFKFGQIYSRQEINVIFKLNKINNPTRFTYNRWNMGQNDLNCFFEYLGNAKYKYLGFNANFTGPCFHYPKGNGKSKIGDWVNGKFIYVDTTVLDFPHWKKNIKLQKKN